MNSYIEPAVNLVDHGTCYELYGGKVLFAHKMPGMVPVFAPLYYFFGYNGALAALVVIQFLLDAVCCVLLGLISLRLFKRVSVFRFVFYGYALSSIVSVSTHYAVSELFCTSFSIVGVYFLTTTNDNRKINYFLAGLFFTWAVFFRPTALLLFLISGTYFLILLLKKESRKGAIVSLLYLALPFIVFESLWIARNEILLKRFVPAEISYENYGTPALLSLYKLVQATGGDHQAWNTDSELKWFLPLEPGTREEQIFADSNPFPAYLIEAGIDLSRLKEIRSEYLATTDSSRSKEEIDQMSAQLDRHVKAVISDFRHKAPFAYYVKAPLRSLSIFLFIKRPYGFNFPQNGIIEKLVRLWHFIWYYVVLVAFILSLFFRPRALPGVGARVVGIYPLVHILLIGFILHFTENRYLVPAYPFMIILGAAAIDKFLERLYNNRRNAVSI